MDSKSQPSPKVVSTRYIVRRPFICCEIWVSGDDYPFGLSAYGAAFAKCERGDSWDESFGCKVARKRALAEAEEEYHRGVGELKRRRRMREAEDLVRERYPVDSTNEACCAKSAQDDNPLLGMFTNILGCLRIPFYPDNAATEQMLEENAKRDSNVSETVQNQHGVA
jgi:hypothetical protein